MYVNEHFPIVWDPARCRQTHNLSQARTFTQDSPNRAASFSIRFVTLSLNLFLPPARWGLLDFMSIASSPPPLLLLPDLNHDHPPPVFPAGLQPRLSTPSVPYRTSTTIIHTQCSLPDLNHDHPTSVFPAGPQPRPSTPSVPYRTSTTTIQIECQKISQIECQIECQEICQKICQKICQTECQ